MPEAVHAVLVQSTIGAGAITGFELDAAQAMPGVLVVITPDNAPKLQIKIGAQQTVQAPLRQDRDIHYNGQHVAVVVAATLEQAGMPLRRNEACDIVATSLSRRWMQVLAQAYPPKNFRNGERPPDSKRGDPDAAFDGAAVKVDATYITPIEHHNPMEPHATIARWDDDRLTVWTATQGISGAQQTLAALFGIDKSNVRVICPYVGGGFGCKGSTWPPATLAAMAARVVGKPVKLVLTRAQMFTSNGYRPRDVPKSCASPLMNRGGLFRCVTTGSLKCRNRCWVNLPGAGRVGDGDALRVSECRGDASTGRYQRFAAHLYAGASTFQRRLRA